MGGTKRLSSIFFTRLLLAGAILLISFTPALGQHGLLGRRARYCPPICECGPCDSYPGLVFQAGPDPENLQVHVTGPAFDVIEIYFLGQFFKRYDSSDLPGLRHLQRDKSVALASQNQFGTFAVRYGPYQDTFWAYAWKKDGVPVPYGPFCPEPGFPVCLHWVTSRILKVTYGHGQQKSWILQFNDVNPPDEWKLLYKSVP